MRPHSHRLLRRPRSAIVALAAACLVGGSLAASAPASAHGDRERLQEVQESSAPEPSAGGLLTGPISHVSSHPGQVGISGCFTETAPLFVASGLDSVVVYDVSDGTDPQRVGTLPSLQFENEAMNCGERRTRRGVRRFALIGVDLYQASPDDIQHVNAGGGELVVVEVTDPANPTIVGRAPGSTSTHTVACVDPRNCRYAYSAGSDGRFSVFDLRDLEDPEEVDARPRKDGLQSFRSPTAGHKWNFDAAGVGTHTGFDGSSMWDTDKPRRPRLLATTGKAGKGSDPDAEGYNDFIHHNSYRPHAKRFRPHAKPRLRNGNVLLVTEEDYEQTDCSQAGSFQTWWIKRLDGGKGGIVPLDKVELNDLRAGQDLPPLPQGAFCSSHWFDYHKGGIVAAGFYGGGTQIIDVRRPRRIKPYASAFFGVSEVWDAMWLPVYDERGRQTRRDSNVVYSIDLVRGLDVYAVDLPGDRRSGAVPYGAVSARTASGSSLGAALPLGLAGAGVAGALWLRRRVRPRRA